MASWCSLDWSLALPFLGFVNSMTLQWCPGGTGFYKSVNTRKAFMCALYSHEKQIPKTAPGSKGVSPDGAPRLASLENGSWLPEVTPEELMCRAVYSASLVALLFGYVLSDSPGRHQ